MSDDLEQSRDQVTQILARVREGDRQAAEDLLPLVYTELRRLAQSRMAREKPGQTLQPTALVHEAYMRLIGKEDPGWDNRGHFFGAAAEAMRRIMIERARRYSRIKHGGEFQRVDIDGLDPEGDVPAEDILALDFALQKLEERDAKLAELVKLRFFGGLSVEETAAAMESSPRTINRQWAMAKAWLYREMDGDD